MSLTPTLVAGRYRLSAEIGRGGMGVVWEGYDELLHRTVAIKEVRYPVGISEEERDKLARRTLREARAVAAVEDPHAVRVFDIVEQDGRPWIVMELVRGPTLTDAIRERGALPNHEVARIGIALAEALGAAHAAGVLHRDVKPSNVILRDDGRVALTDFGIATVDSDPTDLTTSGQLVGSPAYMAPERARGDGPTAAADLWSLGATLWTAAEGRPPFAEGNAFATMTKVVTEDPPHCARCDRGLAEVITALMSRDPGHRPSVEDVRSRLADIAAGDQDEAPPYPTEPLPPAFDRTIAFSPTSAAPAASSAAPQPAEPATVAGVSATAPRRRLPRLPVALALIGAVVLAGVLAAVLESRGSGSPSRASGHQPSSSAAPAAASGVPAGWRRYTDGAAGWSVAVPAGWTPARSGADVFFRDPAGGRYLQVATTDPAGPSAIGAWESQEQSFRASHTGYQRIALHNVTWRNYPDVADWEFTYTSGAVSLHAVDRGVVVGHRGFGLFFQTHSDQWQASQGILAGIYDSFRP